MDGQPTANRGFVNSNFIQKFYFGEIKTQASQQIFKKRNGKAVFGNFVLNSKLKPNFEKIID